MRTLGQDYMNTSPVSFIISNRFIQLKGYYSQSEMLGSLFRLARRRLNCKKHPIDRHILNLASTYGQKKVLRTYKLIYGNRYDVNIKAS
jgi:hypothetical protein